MFILRSADARELGEALLDAVRMLSEETAYVVSVEVNNGRAIAVVGDSSDNTIVTVLRGR